MFGATASGRSIASLAVALVGFHGGSGSYMTCVKTLAARRLQGNYASCTSTASKEWLRAVYAPQLLDRATAVASFTSSA